MKSTLFPSIPTETAKAALAVFCRSNFYLAIGDTITGECVSCDSAAGEAGKQHRVIDHRGKCLFDGLILGETNDRSLHPARTIAMLYLITIFQFIETLPDQMAGSALRERIDWKYALHLPMRYPGMPAETFCEFRRCFLSKPVHQANLQILLQRVMEIMDSASRQNTPLEAREVVRAVCQFSRLESIWEAIVEAMQAVATSNPEWLLDASQPHWYDRYSNPARNLNLAATDFEKRSLAESIGADGFHLLEAIIASRDAKLAGLSEVRRLGEVWRRQFEYVGGKLTWRRNVCADCTFPVIQSNSAQIEGSPGGVMQGNV